MANATSKTATSSRSDPLPIPTGTRDQLEEALGRLPFGSNLSFEPLLRKLSETAEASTNERCEQARALVQSLKDVDELRGAITDPEVLERHRDTIRLLMSFVFPELMDDEMLVRAYAPFAPSSLFSTRKYREVFGAENVRISQALGTRAAAASTARTCSSRTGCCSTSTTAWRREHGAFVKQVRDGATGLDRFFMNEGSFRFVEVSYPGKELPPQHEFSRLLDMEDLEALVERLPLDGVVFSGFLYIRYVEITELHNLSLLKSELVEPDMLNSPERFERIVERLRSILQVPDLDAGLALRYQSRTRAPALHGAQPPQGLRRLHRRHREHDLRRGRSANRTPLFVPDLDGVRLRLRDRGPPAGAGRAQRRA